MWRSIQPYFVAQRSNQIKPILEPSMF
ncbi:hypothetical protein Goklo_024962 [Gossypium klotzschianum]|uniref:Uncharacterized protein n=1 Tax=Gossypium klotzschianum TaxID=34286 RepID=A0A7J8WAK2_9ROSI|nr:hypothetical protein [Gossypium klotzschianum]